jgi:hypothetical protein
MRVTCWFVEIQRLGLVAYGSKYAERASHLVWFVGLRDKGRKDAPAVAPSLGS